MLMKQSQSLIDPAPLEVWEARSRLSEGSLALGNTHAFVHKVKIFSLQLFKWLGVLVEHLVTADKKVAVKIENEGHAKEFQRELYF